MINYEDIGLNGSGQVIGCVITGLSFLKSLTSLAHSSFPMFVKAFSNVEIVEQDIREVSTRVFSKRVPGFLNSSVLDGTYLESWNVLAN